MGKSLSVLFKKIFDNSYFHEFWKKIEYYTNQQQQQQQQQQNMTNEILKVFSLFHCFLFSVSKILKK